MIKKQRKRIIIIILFIFIIFLVVFFIQKQNNKKLDEKINNLSENSIIFTYDSTEENFRSFQNSIEEIKYLNDMYNLNIQFFDIKSNKKIYQKLKKKNKDFMYHNNPIIQIIKKENSIFFQNIGDKKEMLSFFKKWGYIDDNYNILTVDEFNNLEKDNKQYLIVIENRDKNSIKLRKEVFHLSQEFNFKFYIFEPLIFENIGLNYNLDTSNLPYIIIYKNNKVQTIIYDKNNKKIKQKLLETEFILK